MKIIFLFLFIPLTYLNSPYAKEINFDLLFDDNSLEKNTVLENTGVYSKDAENKTNSMSTQGTGFGGIVKAIGKSILSCDNCSGSSGSSSQHNYTCSFHCVGRWDQWRGGEHTVTTSASGEYSAVDNVKKSYESMCKKYPFHKGKYGGGSASVGRVSCSY